MRVNLNNQLGIGQPAKEEDLKGEEYNEKKA